MPENYIHGPLLHMQCSWSDASITLVALNLNLSSSSLTLRGSPPYIPGCFRAFISRYPRSREIPLYRTRKGRTIENSIGWPK